MSDKLMYIPNDGTQNYPFCKLQLKRLDTQLNEPTNKNSIIVHKVVKPTNKKTLFGDRLIKQSSVTPPPPTIKVKITLL